MPLDIRTFYLLVAIVSFSIGSVMALSGRRYRNIPGLDLWSVGTFALATGLTAFFLRTVTPLWFSIIIGNALIVLHPVMIWNGLRSFNNRPGRWVLPLGGIAVLMGVLTYFSYFRDDLATRTIIVSALMASGYLFCAVELLQETLQPSRRTALVAATAMLTTVVTLCLRILMSSHPDLTHFTTTTAESLRGAVTTTAAIVISVCLLLMAMQRLQQRIEERTVELEIIAEERDQARSRAEQANLAKSNFLAMMSHELRTPLNAILGFSEVIRDTGMEPVGPLYRGYADDIHNAGQHLLDLINAVLDLSKVEVGRLELYEEVVDLGAIVVSCTQLIGASAEEGSLTLETSIPEDLPPLLGDRLRLKQIVLNLLSNAVKFTPSGGKVSITVSLPAAGGLELTIADTGIGMRKEDIPIAIAPFMQLENPLNREYEGTGLGLPLTKSLAELHGGSLEVESEPKRGTIVRVFLPESRIVRAAAP
jgi:signal transduction histidine kinase